MSRWNESLHPRRPDGKFGHKGGWLDAVEQGLPAPQLLQPNRPGERFNPKAGLTPEQAKRMKRWRRDATRPAGVQMTRRQARIAQLKRDREQAQKQLDMATIDARQDARRNGMPAADAELLIDLVRRGRQRDLDGVDRLLARFSDPSYDPDGFIDTPDYTTPGGTWLLTNKPDPKRPLAIYGDMLHIGGAAGSYRHLEELEKIPVRFHAVVAQHMLGGDSNSRGIWVSTQSVPFIDDNKDLIDVEPRGWGKGKTWKDVDGAHRPARRQLIAGHSPNADAHGHSAVIHEFGHALDHALDNASKSKEWNDAYIEALTDATPTFNPYFKQSGNAGPQELWAEAFAAWVEAHSLYPDSRDDRLIHMQGRLRVLKPGIASVAAYFDNLDVGGSS